MEKQRLGILMEEVVSVLMVVGICSRMEVVNVYVLVEVEVCNNVVVEIKKYRLGMEEVVSVVVVVGEQSGDDVVIFGCLGKFMWWLVIS